MGTACDVPETLSGRHALLGHWRRGLLRGQVASTCSLGGCDWSPGGGGGVERGRVSRAWCPYHVRSAAASALFVVDVVRASENHTCFY